MLELLISSFTSANSFSTLFSKTNSSWLIFKSIKATQIKTSMLFSLDFANHIFYHVSFSFSWRRQKLSKHIKPNHKNIALSMKEATQKYRKLTDCFLCPSLCLLPLAHPSPSAKAEFLQFLDKVLHQFKTYQVIICAVYSFVFWFENGVLQVKPS